MAEIGSPHQLAGAQSGVSCNSTSPVQVEGKDDDFHDRQRDDGVLPKEAGGDEIASVTQTVDENTETGTPAADQHSTETHCGSTECTSGPGVTHRSGIPSEWSLSTEPFQWVMKRSPWGPPQVDMFANSLNFKLKDYISACPDPQALAVDALNCQWPVGCYMRSHRRA